MKYCKTCELTARRDAGMAPLWDCIHRTRFWDVVHSYDTALPGWLILVARRHIEAIDELTDEEAVELGILLRRVSLALKEVTGCLKTYVIQFAEMAEHPHYIFISFRGWQISPKSAEAQKSLGIWVFQKRNESVKKQ